MVVALVKFQDFTCEGFLLSKVPKFAALVKLLATTYKRVLFSKIADFCSSFSNFSTSREEPLTVTRDGSRTTAVSKMELFVIIING